MATASRFLILIVLIVISSMHAMAQTTSSCGYPLRVSADSLVCFVVNECEIKTGRGIGITDKEWKKYFYDNTKGIKYDSAFAQCQNYLLKKLGKDVYCNYVDMFLNSFSMRPNGFDLTYGLQLPNLVRKHRSGYIECNYERIVMTFKMTLRKDGSLNIVYPTNVPDCHGLPDCGFVITKNKAIDIAIKAGVVKNDSEYNLTVDGIDWNIIVSEKDGVYKSMKINLQTGKTSAVITSHRID